MELLSHLAMLRANNNNNNNNIEESDEVKVLDEVDGSLKTPPSSSSAPVDGVWPTTTTTTSACILGGTKDGCGRAPCICLEQDLEEEEEVECVEGEQEVKMEEKEEETGTGGEGMPPWHTVFSHQQWLNPIEISTVATGSVENGKVGSDSSAQPRGGEGLLQTVDWSTFLMGIQQQQPSPPVSKPKKKQTFTVEQRDMMEIIFTRSRYPSPATYELLASQLFVPEKSIRTWFQNKRSYLTRLKQKHARYTPWILKQLESTFAQEHVPSPTTKRSLANRTCMSMSEIDHWFTVRRRNWNKARQGVSQVLNNHIVEQPQNNAMWKHHQQQQQERLALALNPTSRPTTTTVTNPRPTTTTTVEPRSHYQTSSQPPPLYARPDPRAPATVEPRYQTVPLCKPPPTIRPVASSTAVVNTVLPIPSAWGGNQALPPVYYYHPSNYSPFAANNLYMHPTPTQHHNS